MPEAVIPPDLWDRVCAVLGGSTVPSDAIAELIVELEAQLVAIDREAEIAGILARDPFLRTSEAQQAHAAARDLDLTRIRVVAALDRIRSALVVAVRAEGHERRRVAEDHARTEASTLAAEAGRRNHDAGMASLDATVQAVRDRG